MKRKTAIIGLAAVVCLIGSFLQAQKPADLVGTWSGMATLKGLEAPNELTLVLEMKDGKLVGTMSDQYETINEFPIGDVTLEKGVLSFTTPVIGPGGQQTTMKYKMTISGETMKGEIEIPEMGMTGAWEAARRK